MRQLAMLVLAVTLLNCAPRSSSYVKETAVVARYLQAAAEADSFTLGALSLDSIPPWVFPASPAKRHVFAAAAKGPLELMWAQRNGDTTLVVYQFRFLPDSLRCQSWDPPFQVQLVQKDRAWVVRSAGMEPC